MSDQRWHDQWRQTRAQGVWRFVLRDGVLWFALPLATVTIIWDYFTYRSHHNWPAFIRAVYVSLVLYPILGVIYGLFLWCFYERLFRKVATASELPQPDGPRAEE